MYYISLSLEKSEKSREQWKPAHFEKKNKNKRAALVENI